MEKSREEEAMLNSEKHQALSDAQGFNCQNQTGVVYAQPVTVVVANTSLPDPPPDYIAYSIIVTLLCCWPIGIFAILKSLACRDAISRGDRERAVKYSRDARKLGHFTLGVGIVFLILTLIMCIAAYAFWIIPVYKQARRQAEYSGYD